MDETPLPITTSLKLEQLLKQLLDIVEILLGIEMLVRLVQYQKASSPIDVTFSGIEIVVRLVHS